MQGLPARLRVVGELGRGAMGIVLDAVDESLGRRVAIKVLPPDVTGATDRARLLREAKAVAQLASPHVVRVFEAGPLDDGGTYVVMERLEGETLEACLARRGPLPVEEALAIARDVLDALAEAHAAGLVHRDVKPANVMLVAAPGGVAAKLLDFGLVQDASAPRLTATGEALGSPAYMAPEQIRAERVDARADVWSVGATLQEVLTGEVPFVATSVPALLVAILRDQPRPLPPSVPEGVRGVVARCLAKDAAARFADARELRAALEGPAPRGGRVPPPASLPAKPRPRAPRPRGRGQAGLFVATSIAVLVVGGAVIGVVVAPRARVQPAPSATSEPSAAPHDAATDDGGGPPLPSALPLPVSASSTVAPPRAAASPRRLSEDTQGGYVCLARLSAASAGTVIWRAVCVEPKVSMCRCRWSGSTLCQDWTDAAPCSETAVTWPSASEGQRCTGFVSDGRYLEGRVECEHCMGHPRYVGVTPGAACRGVTSAGEWLDGTWRPAS